jgi:hypothetical protein
MVGSQLGVGWYRPRAGICPFEDKIILRLGGDHPSLHGAIHFTRNGRFFQLWRECIHVCLRVIGRLLVGETPTLDVGLAKYDTVLVQWYVIHSLERRLAGRIFDDEL